MPVCVSLDQIDRLAPGGRANYRTAFGAGQTLLDRYGISDSSLRVAHFVAQLLHESGGLTMQYENLMYSAERLPQVWPRRFRPKGPLDPAKYAYNERKLANAVYGGRLGNTAPDDGFTYRGRGLLQLTGKDSYARATTSLRLAQPDAPDFISEPDALLAASWCLAVAASEWDQRGCNEMADRDDVEQVTRRINGGIIGLADRRAWTRKTRQVWQ